MRTDPRQGLLPPLCETARALAVLAATNDASHLRAVIELLPVAVLFYAGSDPRTAELREHNAPAVEMLGCAVQAGAPAATTAYQLYPPDGEEALPVDRHPWARALRAGQEIREEEIHILRADGLRRVVTTSAVPVSKEGRTVGALWVLKETTERKQTEAGPQQTPGRLDALLAMLPAGVSILDADGEVSAMNPLFEAIWAGNAPTPPPRVDSIEDVTAYRGWWPETGAPIRPEEWASTRALTTGETVFGEVIDIERFDGTRATILNNAAPLRDAEGGVTGAVVAIQDITRLRHHQQELSEAHRRLQVQSEELQVQSEELLAQSEELQSANEELQAQAKELRSREDALRRSEAHARHRLAEIEAIYHSAHIGLCVLDTDLRFVRINERLAEINGVPAQEHLGKSIVEVVPDLSEQALALLHQILETGEPALDVEFIGTTPAQPGVQRTWVEQWLPLRAPDGRILGISVVAEEITERKHIEGALRASEERYRSLFDRMTEGFALHEVVLDEAGRPCDYRFLEANTAFEQFTGLKRHDVVGHLVSEVLPGIEAHWIDAYGKVALTGEPVHFESYASALDRHYQVYAYRPAPLQFAAIFLDVTGQKRMESALAQSERLLDAIFENILAQVAYLDRDMNFVRVNAAYAEGCGHRVEDLIGRNHFELFPNPENEAIFARVRDTGEPYVARTKPFAFANQPERGITYWDWWLRPIHSVSGETEGVVLSLVDVTAVEQARQSTERLNEALSEADRQKDEFLAMLAHELRNPLAAVSSAVQLLRMPGLGEPAAERARGAAVRQASHMARLLDDLLDVSRITRGKVTLKQQDVAVNSFIEGGIEAAAPLVEARGHRLLVSLPRVPLHVHGDPVRLAQIVANLLSNAAKYTPAGGEIRLTADPGEGEIGIRVRDNGLGIPAETLPRVFDLFVQGDRSPDRQQGGLGIGLTMVRALVEMHGGRVDAFSGGPGRGSEFVVRLPLVDEHSPSASSAGRPAPAVCRRVLVVDDNEDAAELLALLLEGEGHHVQAVHSGAAALDAISTSAPQVVLLDIGMPGMDGFEVARRLRADPRHHDLLLVALTGYGQDEDRERTREAGFDLHLVKPVDPDALRDALASLG